LYTVIAGFDAAVLIRAISPAARVTLPTINARRERSMSSSMIPFSDL
jgi:3-methyladenine DNA glycosylase Mpg